MKSSNRRTIKIILISTAVISSLWIFWLSLTPVIDRDALRFHLSFAKLWAENGFLYFRPHFAFYDLNMLNLNYLYMLVFKFGLPDQLTKVIHASFLIAGSCLIFKYFKDKYGFNWGAISFLMYITIPVHQRLASEVYVDLGLLFFSTLSIIYFIKWFETDFAVRKYLIISAIGAGLAFGTKYNGMITAFFLTLFVGLVLTRRKRPDITVLRSMGLYALIIFLCASPWLIRNFINSGNPFFPLFTNIIPSSLTMPEALVENVTGETAYRVVGSGDGIIKLFLLPLRVFFEGRDNDLLRFDGVLNPFILIFSLFAFIKGPVYQKRKKILRYISALFVVAFLTTLYSNNIRIRYFISLFPLLIFLNIEGLRNLYYAKRTQKYKPLVLLLIPLYLSFNIVYAADYFQKIKLNELNPFSKNSKENYLKEHLHGYKIYSYINSNTPQNSVIYEAMNGGRSYYVDRTYYCDTSAIDRYLLELIQKGASKEEYREHFSNLPNSELSATHLIFSPERFIDAFKNIQSGDKSEGQEVLKSKIRGLADFLNELKILAADDNLYLFKL
ncbi:MAG: glycosyltransferase family 39 protein [Candidatus Delongbacteria bacterium]